MVGRLDGEPSYSPSNVATNGSEINAKGKVGVGGEDDLGSGSSSPTQTEHEQLNGNGNGHDENKIYTVQVDSETGQTTLDQSRDQRESTEAEVVIHEERNGKDFKEPQVHPTDLQAQLTNEGGDKIKPKEVPISPFEDHLVEGPDLLGINLDNGRKNPFSDMYTEDRPCTINIPSGGLFDTQKRRLMTILKQKQSERKADFARLSTLYRLDDEKNSRVANLGFEELVNGLQRRDLTATQVLESFIAKALEAHSRTNAITDFNPRAFAIAKELDSLEKPKGPLHGIPFCVKDDNNLEGMDSTHGFVKNLYKPSRETATIVKILMDLGAVPFCKTNVPQTLFTYGSDNPVFGTTVNAQNPELSPGGSSSGTGALVGAGGVFFGTGTDIGGSLRIPAHFNGASALKPTISRLSDLGIESSLPNLIGMTAVCGIIAQNPTILGTIFKCLLEKNRQHKYDPQIPPIPWENRIFESKAKLRIGYFTNMPFFPPMGDTEEVVMRAKERLELLGHTLVPYTPPDAYNFMKNFGQFIMADNCRHFKKNWKGEEIAKGTFLLWLGSKLPRWMQRLVGRIMRTKAFPLVYSKRTGQIFGTGAEKSTDLWDAQGEKKLIKGEVFAEWKRKDIDVLLCPIFPFAACGVNYPGMLPVAVCYSMLWNLVDLPAGVLPFGLESGKNLNCYDCEGDAALKLALKGVKKSVGSPIAVQIVGLPFKEEMVLRVLKELEPFSNSHK